MSSDLDATFREIASEFGLADEDAIDLLNHTKEKMRARAARRAVEARTKEKEDAHLRELRQRKADDLAKDRLILKMREDDKLTWLQIGATIGVKGEQARNRYFGAARRRRHPDHPDHKDHIKDKEPRPGSRNKRERK